MITTVIITVSVIQLLLYLIADRAAIQYGRLIIFLLVLSAHLLFLPNLFYPRFNLEGVKCAMPIVGVTLAFWVIGGLTSISIHIVYSLLSRYWHTK